MYNDKIGTILASNSLQNLLNLTYKANSMSAVSIDSKTLSKLRVSYTKFLLVWDYIFEYVVGSTDEDITSIMKIVGLIDSIQVSNNVTFSSDMLKGADTDLEYLIAGEGLNGSNYNTSSTEVWSLDDLLASPTDEIIVPNSI